MIFRWQVTVSGNAKIGIPKAPEPITSVMATSLTATVPNIIKPDRNVEAMNAKERTTRRGVYLNSTGILIR